MECVVTNGKQEQRILTTDSTDALEYYASRIDPTPFRRGQGLWVCAARVNALAPYVKLEWLDWRIPGLEPRR